jgi:thiosulfate/3-mercaptopyruvate sulfurtransferase
MAQYAHPEVLVSIDWVKHHLNDATVRIVEVGVETNAYELGHIPGAIAWSWQSQLSDQVRRDVLKYLLGLVGAPIERGAALPVGVATHAG